MRAIAIRTETEAQVVEPFTLLIERFFNSQDIKASSKKTYQGGLTRFVAWVRAKGIGKPTREDILDFKSYLEAQGLSSSTLSTYLVAVRALFKWTEAERYYPDISRGIKGAKKVRGFKKDPLTAQQVKSLLSNINRSTLQGKRDFALLNLFIRTGLRTIEVIRAGVADLRQDSGEALLWIQGKGRDTKDEFVLLTQETLRPLYEYLQARGRAEEGGPLFTSLSDRNKGQGLTTRTLRGIVKNHLRGIGLDSGRLTAHSLRHTAITLSLLGGASLQEAQALGRHANINTTLIYSHNINRTGPQAPERKIDALLAQA